MIAAVVWTGVVFHEYVVPPVAVNVVLVPLQTIEVPVMAAVGLALIVTNRLAVFVQPKLFVTVTV